MSFLASLHYVFYYDNLYAYKNFNVCIVLFCNVSCLCIFNVQYFPEDISVKSSAMSRCLSLINETVNFIDRTLRPHLPDMF